MHEITPATVRALCCECGNLRTVSRRAHPGGYISEFGVDNGQPVRMVCSLKCGVCKQITRHALLRDHEPPEYRDFAERVDKGRVSR